MINLSYVLLCMKNKKIMGTCGLLWAMGTTAEYNNTVAICSVLIYECFQLSNP